MNQQKQDALAYHSGEQPGKLEVRPTKPCLTQVDLSMAYSPGVAWPTREIQSDPQNSYLYTNRANLVAVISNGTATLGLGNTGALASKPVMEGKGVLFKRFSGIDVYDLELDTEDRDEFIRIVQAMEPTFGGINLEDIAAPDCFYIERELKERMDIPVFHDDQHGTAIIAGAALINGLDVTGRERENSKVVISGAGAAGIACAKFFQTLGIPQQHIIVVDSSGVLHKQREDLNPYKQEVAVNTDARTLSDAMEGADVFFGMSVGGIVTKEMVASMNAEPIVFACANPDPEIKPEKAREVRDDVIIGTGRSDYPNQINNVLAFPFIFRGALDVRATGINEEMKLAAAHSLAQLARRDVPQNVLEAYGKEQMSFGPEYLIPKPLDQRILLEMSTAVAKAAMDSGVARKEQPDLNAYRHSLERFLGRSREVMRGIINKARHRDTRILFPEACEENILRACRIIVENEIAEPVLIGEREKIQKKISRYELELNLDNIELLNPEDTVERQGYVDRLFELRNRKGMTRHRARMKLNDPHYVGLMTVREGHADGLVCGINRSYPETIRPALQIVGLKEGVTRVAGMYLLIFDDRLLFYADATVNIDPDAKELAEIAIMAGQYVNHFFDIQPRIGMLSFSNFGSSKNERSEKVARATRLIKQHDADLCVDGEMQADTALVQDIAEKSFPHSAIKGDANILIFPDLEAGNIAYKITQHLAEAELVGPIIMGMRRPVNVLNHYSTVNEIVNMTAISAVSDDDVIQTPPAVI